MNETKRLDIPELKDLYCKWCPKEQECDEDLTLEEKRGCVACDGFAGEILALISPLIEDAKKQERERVLGILQREYPAIDTWQCWKALKEGKEE